MNNEPDYKDNLAFEPVNGDIYEQVFIDEDKEYNEKWLKEQDNAVLGESEEQMGFEIKLEDMTQDMLTEKIVKTIKEIGKPQQIKYGKRVGTITVWDTATLIYSAEKSNDD